VSAADPDREEELGMTTTPDEPLKDDDIETTNPGHGQDAAGGDGDSTDSTDGDATDGGDADGTDA
jgi:hypothetical protein